MELLVKLTEDLKKYSDFFGLKGDLKKQVSIREAKLKGKKGLLHVLRIHNKDYKDYREIEMFNAITIHKGIKLIKIQKMSRAFRDINNVEEGQYKKEWADTLKKLKDHKSTKFIKISKRNEYTWIGIYNLVPNSSFNPKYIEWLIYKIGFGLGLVPKDFTIPFEENKGYYDPDNE